MSEIAFKAFTSLQSHAAPMHVASVTLAARDLSALADFYEAIIGLDRLPSDGSTVLLGSGGEAYLRLVKAEQSAADDQRAAGLFHTAFLMPSRAALGAWFAAAYQQRGVQFEGASDHGVSEAFYLSDPEGNGIEVYADRPRALWGRSAEGFVMGTSPMDIGDVAAEGQRIGGSARFPAEARIGHVHLRVGDIAAAEQFYINQLGFAAMARRPGATFLATGGYHHHIAVNTWQSRGAGKRNAGMAGLAEVAFGVNDASLLARIGDGPVTDPWGTCLTFHAA
jgi:catechol 2,3-dioxygenase